MLLDELGFNSVFIILNLEEERVNEVVACWSQIVKRDKTAGLLLSRQNLPVIDRNLYNSTAEVASTARARNVEDDARRCREAGSAESTICTRQPKAVMRR